MKILVIVIVGTITGWFGSSPIIKTIKSDPMPAASCEDLMEKSKNDIEIKTVYCEDAK